MSFDDVPVLSDYSHLVLERTRRDALNGRDATKLQPAISVVTITYNASATLKRSMDSVVSQSFSGKIEYILVDGGSRDATVDIIQSYGEDVSYWISEPDRGISDAFNKGVALSAGKYVAIVNADDWLEPGQLAAAFECLESSGADFCFGDLIYHASSGASHRIIGDPEFATKIKSGMPALNHPTVVVRRAVYQKHGLFSLRYRRAMDYDLLLRFYSAGSIGIYDSNICGHMGLGGVSDRKWMESVDEVRTIAISFGRHRIVAWAEFIFRIVKGFLRRQTEKLPKSFGGRLRECFNSSFRRS